MSNLKIPKWFGSPEFRALRDSNLPPSDVQRNIPIEMQGLLKKEPSNTTVEKSYLKSIETILSPIKALPYDILIEVFLQCLPKRVSFHLRRHPNISESAPLLLTHICSSWRSLVLETPSLWTTLTFVADNYIETYDLSLCTEATEFCKLWLSRAKNLPLNFNLHVPYPDSKQYDLFGLFMKETLLRYLPRFRNLMLASYEIGSVLEFLGWICYNSNQKHRIEMSCDTLETLEFQSTGYLNVREEEREMRGFLEIFKHAPRLRRLVWDMNGKRAPDVYLPLQVLTHLSISRLPPSHINSLVRKCPSLRCGAFHLTVEDEEEDDEDEESGPLQTFILEHLHSLLIITNNDSPMDPFKNMEFPTLTSLFLSSSRRVYEISHIGPFLPHLHNIQRLVLLHYFKLSDEQWLTLLRSTPNLVELELANHYDLSYQFLFMEMTITEDDRNGREPLIPHLQILIIEFVGYMYRGEYYAKAPEFFIAMVQSRLRGSGNALASESKCLQSVSIFIVSMKPGEAKDESILQRISDGLRSCVDAGLELNIHHNQYKKYWMLTASEEISNLHSLLMAPRQLVNLIIRRE